MSGGWTGHLRAWDVSKRTAVFRAQAESWIERIVFRPMAPTQVAIVGGTRVTSLWDLQSSQSWKLLDDYQGVVSQTSDVSWCGNGQVLASSAGRDVVTLLKVSNAPQRINDPEWGYVNSVAWDPACRRLAIGAWTGLYLWDTDTMSSVRVGRHMNDAVNATQLQAEGVLRVAWSPDGDLLATGGQDRTVRVWRPDSDREPEVLSGHTGAVFDVVWSGGDRFATASADGTVRIWSKEPFSSLYTSLVIHAGQGQVYSVAWSPDGETLASGGDTGGIRIWRGVRGTEVVTLSGRQGTLDVTNEGELVFDGRSMTDDQLLELVRRRAARSFTSDECEKFFHGTCP